MPSPEPPAAGATDPPARPDPDFLVVGHVSKPHGIKGELFVWPLTDYPETHFAPGEVHHAGDDNARRPSGLLPPLVIAAVRPYRRGFLVRFEGFPDRTAAEALRGLYLLRPFELVDSLADDEIFYHELLGARVVTVEGGTVGEVREVFPVKPSDLLQVEGPGGEVLIPFTREIVVAFDRERRTVVVDPPPGLIATEGPGDA